MNDHEFQTLLGSSNLGESTSSLISDTTEYQHNLLGESLHTEPQGMPIGAGLFRGSEALSPEEEVIESAAARLKSNLIDLTAGPTLETTLTTAFGAQVDLDLAQGLLQNLAKGENGPEIRVVSEDLLKGQGAFGDDTIFISDDLAAGSTDHPEILDRVLLEETGHYLDQALNDVDSPGDEGAIFAHLVQDHPLSSEELLLIRLEDDQSTLWLDQQGIAVELNDGYAAHTIEAGDTLWAIAAEQLGDGSRWPEILKDNQDLNSAFSEAEAAQIQVGQIVYVPDQTESSGAVDPDPNNAEEQPEDAATPENIEPAEETSAPVGIEDTSTVTNTPDTSGVTELPSYPGNTFQYEEGQPLTYDANVEQWQQRMADLGWTIGVDGKYGAESAKVAEEFQELYGDLTDDGIVGEQTWAKTFSADALGPSPEEESDPTGSPSQGNASTGFGNKVEEIAEQEWQYFDQGNLKEGEDRAWQRVAEYWQFIGRSDIDTSQEVSSSSNPWSGAFISWVMNKAGAGDQFNYSALHADYVYKAVIAKNSNDTSEGLWGHRLDEYSPKVGDLINFPRTSNSYNSYDEILDGKSSFPSHSDIVVGINLEKGELTAIGGNVSDTVAIKTFSIDDQGRITGIAPDKGVVLESRIEGGATPLGSVIPNPESANPPVSNNPPPSSNNPGNDSLPLLALNIDGESLAVLALQDSLNILGHDSGTRDGDFGSNTDAAVRRFQEQQNLTVDGKVGENTWAALEDAVETQLGTASDPNLIGEYQRLLNAIREGFPSDDDLGYSDADAGSLIGGNSQPENTETEQQRPERIETLKRDIEALGTDQPNATQVMREELEELLLEEKAYLENQIDNLGTTSTSVTDVLKDQLKEVEAELNELTGDSSSDSADSSEEIIGDNAIAVFRNNGGDILDVDILDIPVDASEAEIAEQAIEQFRNSKGGSDEPFDPADYKLIPSKVHTALDIAGFIPVVGEFADGINAILYLAEGDTLNAALSGAALIPVIGSAGTAGRVAGKATIGRSDDLIGGLDATLVGSRQLENGTNIDLLELPDGSFAKVVELEDGTTGVVIGTADELGEAIYRGDARFAEWLVPTDLNPKDIEKFENYRNHFKKSGRELAKSNNVAFAETFIDGKTFDELVSVSGKKTPGLDFPEPDQRIFDTEIGKFHEFDSEVAIVEHLTRELNINDSGVIRIVSERAFCESCTQILSDFKRRFPNIELLLVDDSGGQIVNDAGERLFLSIGGS